MTVCDIARIFLSHLGDGFGMDRAEPHNQPFAAVFIAVHCNKAGNAVDDAGQKGIGIAPPRFHDDSQGFLINLCAVVFVDVVGRTVQ